MPSQTPAVLVHGLFGSFSDAATFEQLAPRPCSAPDLAGYDGRPGPVTVERQVEELRAHIVAEHAGGPVHLVAHSIGAVYAFALADADPALVASVTSVEGNFSLADAFWSRAISAMPSEEAEAVVGSQLVDPEGFLAGDHVEVTPTTRERAESALAYQPWRTIWESAIAIVGYTAGPSYQQLLHRVLDTHVVHLVAGERSASGWSVPDWAHRQARSSTVIPGLGHLMMLEDPRRFGAALAQVLDG